MALSYYPQGAEFSSTARLSARGLGWPEESLANRPQGVRQAGWRPEWEV